MQLLKSIFQIQISSRLIICPAIVILVFLPLKISAKTLAEYRKNVESAKIAVDEMADYIDDDDGEDVGGRKEDEKYTKQTVAEIIKELSDDKIDWQGATVATDYSWLVQQLEVFQTEKNSVKRAEILTGVGERLEALQVKLNELDNQGAAAQSKDEDKQKLAEILRREEFQKPPEKSENLLQKWYRAITEWIDNLFPKPKITPGNETNFQGFSYVLQILLYAVIAIVVSFLIYKFAPFFLQKYRRREKREKKDRVILGERIAADETSENLFGEAEVLARAGNLRAAIRKGYVALLCELDDRKIIGLAQHKTNRDYLRDVRKKSEIYEDMLDLTDNFERHWYGFQSVNEEDWNDFRNGYKKITN